MINNSMAERSQSERPTGLPRDVGFQIGVRRTLPIHHEDAWRLLTSDQGLGIWLGAQSDLDFTKGATYQLANGIFLSISLRS